MLIGHGLRNFSRMETSNVETSKVTIASLLHLGVFCSLLLRIKCIQEREASVRYVSLVQLSYKNSWEILSPVYRNKLRPRFIKCVFRFTKICKNSFFCHRIFKFVRTGNYFFELFRLRLRMCMSVWGVPTVDVDVDGNLPYRIFIFSIFLVRFLGVRTVRYFFQWPFSLFRYYPYLVRRAHCSWSRTIEMQSFISKPCWFPADDSSRFPMIPIGWIPRSRPFCRLSINIFSSCLLPTAAHDQHQSLDLRSNSQAKFDRLWIQFDALYMWILIGYAPPSKASPPRSYRVVPAPFSLFPSWLAKLFLPSARSVQRA